MLADLLEIVNGLRELWKLEKKEKEEVGKWESNQKRATYLDTITDWTSNSANTLFAGEGIWQKL